MTITGAYIEQVLMVYSSKAMCYEAANMMMRSSGPFLENIYGWFSLCQ